MAASVPVDTVGALEFDRTESSALVYVAVAFFSFGYRVETDLEIVPMDRTACLLLGHHGELVANFCDETRLSSFVDAMVGAGYPVAGEGDDDDDG